VDWIGVVFLSKFLHYMPLVKIRKRVLSLFVINKHNLFLSKHFEDDVGDDNVLGPRREVEQSWMAGEFLLDCSGCGDDVVVGLDVGREDVPEGGRVLLRLGCVSGVVGVVDELLLDVGDDFFDGGHFGC